MRKQGTVRTLGTIGLIVSIVVAALIIFILGVSLITSNSLKNDAKGVSTGTGSNTGNDRKHTSDLQFIQEKLETVFAGDAAYPSLDQLNSATWRNEHMPGLDPQELSPNSGQSKFVADSPTDNSYAYTPSPAGCSDSTANSCTSYTLSAKQSSGTSLTVKSLY